MMNGAGGSRLANVVGIDLGTTNCCLAVVQDNAVNIVEIDDGRTMPSYAAFTDESYIVGQPAKDHARMDPWNTILDSKRLLGRMYGDSKVQSDLRKIIYPFKITENEDGRPVYNVLCQSQPMEVLPELISQLLLVKMKEVAEGILQAPLDGAVITVPAYFQEPQRQATKMAAQEAGIKVLNGGLINEPTAAALAYSLQVPPGQQNTVLVFDLGGGTFDVSVVSVDGVAVEVKCTGGDDHLGGVDFSNSIAKKMLEDIKDRHGVDLLDPREQREDPEETKDFLIAKAERNLNRLKIGCENMKIELSLHDEVTKDFDFLWAEGKAGQRGHRFTARLSRAQFEEVNNDHFQACVNITTETLANAKIKAEQIDKVVLVGGSTRMPKIKRMLSDMFGLSKICDGVNPDEIVAFGAGIQASSLVGLCAPILQDVTSHSMGVACHGDVMSVVLPKNMAVGRSNERTYTTVEDNQTVVKFEVYEGELPQASKNRRLDTFELTGLPRRKAGAIKVHVKFRANFDGTLTINAIEESEGYDVRRAVRVNSQQKEAQIKESKVLREQGKVLQEARVAEQAFYPKLVC